ncbi:MAG: hypothetical protein AAF957_19670 [Planctomycetota bacterium]
MTPYSDAEAAKKAARRKRRSRAMTVIRRVHLYSGLVLVPWVLLYGVTAFLFNHPSVATDRVREHIEAPALEGTPFEGEIDAEELARIVAAAIAESMEEDEETEGEEGSDDVQTAVVEASASTGIGPNATPAPVELTPIDPHFVRDAFLEVRTETARFSMGYDLEKGDMSYSRRSIRPSTESPLDRSRFAPDGVKDLVPSEAWKGGARDVVARFTDEDLEHATVSLRSGPVLQFEVEHEGKRHEVRYDVGRRSVSAEEIGEEEGMHWRSFLLRLHLAHTYPSDGGIRWIWAVFVDLMAFSMVSWALSGLLMWWQIKKTRGVGKWLMILSTVGATAIGIAMYEMFIS